MPVRGRITPELAPQKGARDWRLQFGTAKNCVLDYQFEPPGQKQPADEIAQSWEARAGRRRAEVHILAERVLGRIRQSSSGHQTLVTSLEAVAEGSFKEIGRAAREGAYGAAVDEYCFRESNV